MQLASVPKLLTCSVLVARERANLVGLKLFGSEAGDPSVVESTTHLGCLLKPAGDGVPGNPFDPGNRVLPQSSVGGCRVTRSCARV